MGRKRKAWLVNGDGRRTTGDGFMVQWYDDRGARRSKTFTLAKDARWFLKTKTRQLELAQVSDLLPTSLEEASVEFLSSVTRLAPRSQLSYGVTLKLLAEFFRPSSPVSGIGPSQMDQFLEWLCEPYAPDDKSKKRVRSESTVAKHFRNCRRFFRWAVKREYMPRDPCAAVAVAPQTHSRELAALPSDKDIANLARAIKGLPRRSEESKQRIAVATVLSLTIGWDRANIATLTPEHFDLDGGYVRRVRPKTKRKQPRPVVAPIPARLRDSLRPLLDDTPKGQAMFPEFAHRAWYAEAKKVAGDPWTHLRVSDFRKVASQRLQGVMPLAQASRVLGHATTETTARHYTTLDPSIGEAAEALFVP